MVLLISVEKLFNDHMHPQTVFIPYIGGYARKSI